MTFIRYGRRLLSDILGDEVEKINTKWFKYIHQDEVLYSPFFKRIKRHFVAGPGDRHPIPNEILEAIKDKKGVEYDRDGMCYEYEHHEPGTEIDVLPGGIYNHESYDESNHLPERLEPFDLRGDKFLELGGMHSTVLEAINSFLSSEQIYRESGGLYKTGILMYGPPGEGKCLGKGTPILMYDGSIKKVEEICIGDIIMGDDNSPRNILSVTTGQEMLYKVHQKNGDSYVVNESHIISLEGNDEYEGRKFDISIKDYLEKSNDFKHHTKGYKAARCDFGDKELDIPGYILGYWLGDGSTGCPKITTMDHEVVNEFSLYAESVGLKLIRGQQRGKAYTYSITRGGTGLPGIPLKERNPFVNELKLLECFHEKNGPEIVKKTSYKYRMEFLAGLIDSDGDVNKTGFCFSNKNKSIIDITCFVARSLGFRCSVNSRITKDQNGTICYSFRVNITGKCHEIPTRIKRKRIGIRSDFKNHLRSGIKLEKLDIDEYFGFEIDGNKRFLLGDFTVTHNTAILRHVMKTAFPEDSIIMFCTRIPSDQFIRKMKETVPDRLKVFVFEEIVSMAGNDRQVERILTFLDGENSLDKSMSFATTNFPDKLPSNIVDRPGRFDDVIKFDHPKGDDIKKLAEFFLGREASAEEVESCKGASTAMIQQACIFSKRKKTTIKIAIKEFKRRSDLAKNDFAEAKKMGIGSSNDWDD